MTLLIDRSSRESGLVRVDVVDGSATTQVLVTGQYAVEVVVLQCRNRNEGANAPENSIEGFLISLFCT